MPTLGTVVIWNGTKINGFKILDDKEIFLFLSVESIEEKLGILVEPVGVIRNTEVADLEALLVAAENAGREDLITQLDKGLDYTTTTIDNLPVRKYSDGSIGVEWTTLVPFLNFNKISKAQLIRILSVVSFGLDETPITSLKDARWLLKKYQRKAPPVRRKPGGGFG